MGTRNDLPRMIQNLMVLDYHPSEIHQDLRSWRERADVAAGQNCTRRLFYGFEDEFSDFPYHVLTQAPSKLQGVDAYAHLVQFCLGFENGHYHTHNKRQFFEYWALSAVKGSVGEKYSGLVAFLQTDSSFLHTHITSRYQELRDEVIARDISGQKKGDRVLVIGNPAHINGRDDLSAFTQGIIQVSESKQKGQKGFITLTHPDRDVLEKMKIRIEEMEARGFLRSGISYVDYSELSKAIEGCQCVYITLPMGSNEIAERQIVDAWDGRVNRGNVLTHLQGEQRAKGKPSGLWRNVDLDSFLSIDDVRREMERRRAANLDIVGIAEQACRRCAEFRATRMPMNKDTFFADVPELMPEPA